MIAVDADKLSGDYFEYDRTIYAHPQVDGEGRPIPANADVTTAEGEDK